MQRRIVKFGTAIFSILLAFQAARAQIVGGTIAGTVRNSSGQAVSGASVTVRNLDTGTTRKLTTGADGHFAAPSVPVGTYSVAVSREGFQSQQRDDLFLGIGQAINIPFSLGAGSQQQQAVITGRPVAVNTTTRAASGVVSERQLQALPVNGRSYDELLAQNPAAVNFTAVRSSGVISSNASLGNSFSISGRRPQDNLFLLNGIEYTGASVLSVTPGGVSGQLLGMDAVRGFSTVIDTYGASYGKRDGAQVSIVTMSGTNTLHGGVFEQVRNSAFDARNYFDHFSIPEFQRNQFGGALGGPIRRDKLFLFGNYEGYRQNLGLTSVALVPDNAARQGYLPNSTGTETFVGVNPAVAPLFALWPAQNGPELTANGLPSGVGEAFSNPPQHVRDDFGTLRLDANVTSRDLLFGVYTVDDSAASTYGQNPLTQIDDSLREQVASVQEQHVYSPSVLNTARFGLSRGSFAFTSHVPGDLPGWVAGQPIGTIIISGSTSSSGASQLTQAGNSAGANNASARNLFTADDHVYWSRGTNQIEAGFWLQRIQSNDFFAQNQYGQASFATLPTFLQGTIYTFSVIPQPTEIGWRSLETAAFVEDIWKATPRLELRGGFRAERTNGWNASHGRASYYELVNGVVQTNPVVGSSALSTNNARFLSNPRAAFAWDVRGNGKTALRGGIGLYHSLLDALDYRLDQIAPFNTSYSIKNLTAATAQITPGSPLPGTPLVSPSTVQPDIDTPAVINWSLRAEQEVAPHTTLTVGYIGSHSYHQIISEDLNEPVPTFLPNGTAFYPTGVKNANPALSKTTSWVSQGVGLYSALRVDVRRAFADGVQLRGNYTFAKNLDDGSVWSQSGAASTPAFVEFPLRPKMDWGPATTDVRHQLSVNGSWDLSAGVLHQLLANSAAPARAIAGGWTVSGIYNLQTGLPFTPQLGYNPTGNGDSRNPVRPNWNPAFNGKLYPRLPGQWFNVNAFLPPATGTYGNVSRDSLVGPGASEFDFAAMKSVALEGDRRLQFRADFYNLLNQPNFAIPNEIVYASATSGVSPTAGVITATSTTSRQIQFGAKLLF